MDIGVVQLIRRTEKDTSTETKEEAVRFTAEWGGGRVRGFEGVRVRG
jgi:hypothetical protein